MRTCLSTLLLLGASTAFGTSVCPIVTGGSAGGVGISSAYQTNSAGANVNITNIGCNVLITFNSNGSIVTTNPNTALSYEDGIDDNLIGILNLTNAPILSINLTASGNPAIFDFENDGICDPTFTFSAVGAGGTSPCGGVQGYGHAGVTFSNISGNLNSGTVNFAGGIAANGGSNWFSLEGPVSVSLTVTPGVPEPASVLLLSTGLAGLLFAARRRHPDPRAFAHHTNLVVGILPAAARWKKEKRKGDRP